MMTRKKSWALLPLLCAALVGCDSDIDSDTLVRELRVLSLRMGSSDPQSTAEAQAEVKPGPGGLDLQFTSDHIDVSANIGAPTGPGRRLAMPRPLRYDWFLCVGPASLFSPGTLDQGCRKWLPSDPDPMQNRALRYLGEGQTYSLPTQTLKEVVGAALQILLGVGPGGGGGDRHPGGRRAVQGRESRLWPPARAHRAAGHGLDHLE